MLNLPPQPTDDVVEKPKNKYALKDPPDMRSVFLIEVERRNLLLAQTEERFREELLAEARLLSEQLPPDPQHGQRVHAWVLVLIPQDTSTIKTSPATMTGGTDEEAPASAAGAADEQAANVDDVPTANAMTVIFVEPSTGLQFEQTDARYLGIESVWNHENYYVSQERDCEMILRCHIGVAGL